jgi:hypothetical protein
MRQNPDGFFSSRGQKDVTFCPAALFLSEIAQVEQYTRQ